MDAIKSVMRAAAVCLGWLLLAGLAVAQDSDTGVLERLIPVEGRVVSGGSQSWTFSAASGDILSFFVKDISGGFDPVLTILNPAGEKLISNDDYQYPNNGDALLEAITIPRTGTYTVSVSGFNGEAGAYRLTMLTGFSQVETSDSFNGNLTWEALTEPLQVSAEDGRLALALEGANQRGIAVKPRMLAPEVYFAQVRLTLAGGADGWKVGIASRLQSAEQYYALMINSSGQWRFVLRQDGSDVIIRDWTPHPAIVPGKNEFTLGMLVNGIGYEFFYDGQLFGRLSEKSLPQEGGFGLVVETQGSPASQTTVLFDDLLITVPTLVNNRPIVPQEIVVGTPGDTVQELQRRRLIPGDGEMALTVNESFVESRRPGVERLMLGRGITYENFAIGTTLAWQAASTGITGCGLLLHATDDTHYTLAYIDQMGGYGLSRREGDTFEPGIFGQMAEVSSNRHHLLVISRGDTFYYYVDGILRGTLEKETVEGAVGNAVVNFEPISTSCTFTETWVWRWDEN